MTQLTVRSIADKDTVRKPDFSSLREKFSRKVLNADSFVIFCMTFFCHFSF